MFAGESPQPEGKVKNILANRRRGCACPYPHFLWPPHLGAATLQWESLFRDNTAFVDISDKGILKALK